MIQLSSFGARIWRAFSGTKSQQLMGERDCAGSFGHPRTNASSHSRLVYLPLATGVAGLSIPMGAHPQANAPVRSGRVVARRVFRKRSGFPAPKWFWRFMVDDDGVSVFPTQHVWPALLLKVPFVLITYRWGCVPSPTKILVNVSTPQKHTAKSVYIDA